MYHIFWLHSSIEGHLGSFQLLFIKNKAAMNEVDHVSLLHVGASFGYMPRSGIAGSSGSTISRFLRYFQTDVQSGFMMINSASYLILLNLLCDLVLDDVEYVLVCKFFM